jgi:hypothetical protein
MTYAESGELSLEQIALLKSESEDSGTSEELYGELDSALKRALGRIKEFSNANLEEVRAVGKMKLSTTVGGLLVHVADHTQRHVGQAITTAKILAARHRNG